MTNDTPRPIDDDESTVNGIRYETWTDRETGLAYVRADFSAHDADASTLTDRSDSPPTTDNDVPLSQSTAADGSLFGASGIETIQLSYPYYTSSETVAPYYDRQFTPDWALAAFTRHGYDVLDPETEDDGEILTDGGSDYQYEVTVTITARLPKFGERDYQFSLKISERSEMSDAESQAKDVVPDDAEIIDIETTVDAL